MKKTILALSVLAACVASAITPSTKFGDVPASITLGRFASDLGIALDNFMDEVIITNVAYAVVSNAVPSWAMATNAPISVESDPTVPAWAKQANPPASTDGNAVTNIVAGMSNNSAWNNAVLMTYNPNNASFSTRGGWMEDFETYAYNLDFSNGGFSSTIQVGGGGWGINGSSIWTGNGAHEATFKLPSTSEDTRYDNTEDITDFIALRGDIPTDAQIGNIATNAVRALHTETLTSTSATNLVRAIANTMYDTPMQVLWEQRMVNGNLYYIAVTNVNVQ